jgi:hypothetical protein
LGYILTYIDFLLTSKIVSLAGAEAEGNPLQRWMIDHHSQAGIMMLKGLAFLFLALLALKGQEKVYSLAGNLLRLLNVLQGLVIAWSIFVLMSI